MLYHLDRAFQENFLERDELGASVCVWQDGEMLQEWAHGFTSVQKSSSWEHDTLVPVYSATKAAGAASILLAMEECQLTPNDLVGAVWPRFPVPQATLGQVLSHQCGLAALCRPVSLFNHEECVLALEETLPAWRPPQHGYHPHTFGIILDELMIRLKGVKTWQYWDERVRIPLGLDFYIRLPESEYERVATLIPGKSNVQNLQTPFYQQYLTKGTPIYQAFHSMLGINSVREMNTPQAWSCGAPALTGVASARGLALFYQSCLGFVPQNVFSEKVRQWMVQTQIDGLDETLMTPTAFSCGFMQDPTDPVSGTKLRHLFGQNGFGHAGAGGCHAFADPETGISFAYTMNRMDLNVLPGVKTQSLVDALLQDLL